MKAFVVFSALLAIAAARPGLLPYYHHAAPVAYHAAVAAPVAAVPVEVSSQHHAQDSFGQYNYGYASSLSSKVEGKTFDGVTKGAYSYVDAEGKVQTVEYTADDVHGFQVKASNLPVGPEVPAVAPLEAPVPVEDTAEVAEAKAAHFKAVEEAKALQAATPKEEVVEVAAPVAAPVVAPIAPFAYSAPVAYHHAPISTYAAHPYHYGYNGYPYGYHGYPFVAPVVKA